MARKLLILKDTEKVLRRLYGAAVNYWEGERKRWEENGTGPFPVPSPSEAWIGQIVEHLLAMGVSLTTANLYRTMRFYYVGWMDCYLAGEDVSWAALERIQRVGAMRVMTLLNNKLEEEGKEMKPATLVTAMRHLTDAANKSRPRKEASAAPRPVVHYHEHFPQSEGTRRQQWIEATGVRELGNGE